jgi:hypothetical protein
MDNDQALRRHLVDLLQGGSAHLSMALSIVETLDRFGFIEPDFLAERFAARFDDDPNRGYGPTAITVLHEIGEGVHLTNASRRQSRYWAMAATLFRTIRFPLPSGPPRVISPISKMRFGQPPLGLATSTQTARSSAASSRWRPAESRFPRTGLSRESL